VRSSLAAVVLLAALAAGCGSDPKCETDCDEGMAGDAPSGGMGGGGGGAQPVAGSGGATPVDMLDAGAPVTFDSCLPTASAAPNALTVLYSGELELGALTVRGSRVIASDPAQGIYRVDAAGGTLERIVTARPAEVLVADLNVYWVELDGGISSIYRAGLEQTDATPDVLAQDLVLHAKYLSYDEESLYFADVTASGIYSLPIAGGAPTKIVLDSSISSVLLHAGYLYYGHGGAGLARFDLQTSEVESLAEPPAVIAGPGFLQVDTDNVYFAIGPQIFALPLGGSGMPVEIGQGGSGPGGSGRITTLVLAGDRLYFTDEHGNLGYTSTDGQTCSLLVAGGARSLDLDESAIYATFSRGSGMTGSELVRIER
jgi:hypothetical protein